MGDDEDRDWHHMVMSEVIQLCQETYLEAFGRPWEADHFPTPEQLKLQIDLSARGLVLLQDQQRQWFELLRDQARSQAALVQSFIDSLRGVICDATSVRFRSRSLVQSTLEELQRVQAAWLREREELAGFSGWSDKTWQACHAVYAHRCRLRAATPSGSTVQGTCTASTPPCCSILPADKCPPGKSGADDWSTSLSAASHLQDEERDVSAILDGSINDLELLSRHWFADPHPDFPAPTRCAGSGEAAETQNLLI